MSKRIGAHLGFVAWQTPVSMAEMVEAMFAQGMSLQETVTRLNGRFNAQSVAHRWRSCYASRPSRPARHWRPKTLSAEHRA